MQMIESENMKESEMVNIMLFHDGTYKIKDAPSYKRTYRYYGNDGKPYVGQYCKKDKWEWHLRRLISSLIKDNNKRISMYKKENAYLEKLKSKLEAEK